MKKLLDILEQQVQWLVLLLGVGFMLYMAYTYLIAPPVNVTVSGEKIGPGRIDQQIYETKGLELDQQLHSKPSVTLPAQKSYTADFKEMMNFSAGDAAPLAAASVILPQTPSRELALAREEVATPAPPGPGAVSGPGGLTPAPRVPVTEGPGVAALPELAATTARITDWRSGMSFVTTAKPDATPGAAPPPGMDKTWVTVRYEIDPAALAKAWDDKKVPDRNSNTVFLQVTLERQEKKPDGTWDAATVVQPINAGQLEPFPLDNKVANDTLSYSKWAAQHQTDLLQPPFYTVLKGDTWAPPGISLPDSASQSAQKFDPKQFLTASNAELNKLTREQRQMVARERAKQPKKPGRGVSPGQRTAPAPLRGEAAPALGPQDPDRPRSYQARGAEPEFTDAPEPTAPSANTPAETGQPAAPAAQAPKIKIDLPVPGGDFDPHKWAAEHPNNPLIVGWAHDDTAQPGHTYRYRISYKVKNPLSLANSVVRDPRLAEVFFIASPPSEWSDECEVPSPISFWLVHAGINNNSISVQVFRRQEGDVKTKTFDVVPGDVIGGKDGDVDYSTEWTVVDVRRDARSEAYALLMDKYGIVYRRDVKTDAADPRYQEMKSQASSASTGAAGSALAGAK